MWIWNVLHGTSEHCMYTKLTSQCLQKILQKSGEIACPVSSNLGKRVSVTLIWQDLTPLDICEMQLGVIVSIVCCLLYCDNEIEQLLLWFTWVWWHHGPSHRFIQRRVWWEFWTGTWVCSGLLSSHRIIAWLCPSLSNDRFLVWISVCLSSEFSTRIRNNPTGNIHLPE